MNLEPVKNHPVILTDEELLKECQLDRVKRSGPGGQHRNKVETAVCLTHLPSGIKAEANERRSQQLNKKEAIKRLRVKLACLLRSFHSPDQLPGEVWLKHCKNGKLAISLNNSDYPQLLALALDVIYQESLDLKKASIFLQCTSSQLIRFLKQTPVAWSRFNEDRKEKGLHVYH